MYRSGNYQTGELFCQESQSNITDDFKKQFIDLNLILKDLQGRDLGRAMEWAKSNSEDLAKQGSNLLFSLHKQQFMSLVQKAVDVTVDQYEEGKEDIEMKVEEGNSALPQNPGQNEEMKNEEK
mmetsp:Transcript_16131/g.15517  ORF Transcript_16131/g.15517 Transcript_16131/m.15517 type:complete len:123 (+) Transcript_16131:405-773(+)